MLCCDISLTSPLLEKMYEIVKVLPSRKSVVDSYDPSSPFPLQHAVKVIVRRQRRKTKATFLHCIRSVLEGFGNEASPAITNAIQLLSMRMAGNVYKYNKIMYRKESR